MKSFFLGLISPLTVLGVLLLVLFIPEGLERSVEVAQDKVKYAE